MKPKICVNCIYYNPQEGLPQMCLKSHKMVWSPNIETCNDYKNKPTIFFKSIFRHDNTQQKSQAIMNKIKEATNEQGQCIILSNTPEGTRIVVLGKSPYQSQLEQIAKDNEVIL